MKLHTIYKENKLYTFKNMANTLINKKNDILCEINGVTYFKLVSDYKGDRTKNCSLLSSEIDANFYFLRGMDIKKVDFNKDTKELILTRLNGEQLKTIIPDEKFTLEYDKENGILTVTFEDGTTQSVDGFLVEKDIEDKIKKILGKSVKVATDGTINGDGRVINPLRLSEVERTGTYAPAKYFIDLTDKENVIPEGVYPKGTRIVTKELFTKFGRLYTYEEIEQLKCLLAEQGLDWRVPTKEDWDNMLIAAECPDYCSDECDDIVCHDIDDINIWTGKDAGARAKSISSWEKSEETEDGKPVGGEDNLPDDAGSSVSTIHIVPCGYGEGSRGPIIGDEDSDIEGVGQVASFWTDTPTATAAKTKLQKNYYTRTFSFDTRKVLQEGSKPSSRLSLRLVKDYTYEDMEFKEYESIMGHTVPCVLITDEEKDYAQVWTSINIGFNEVGGVISPDWENLEDAVTTKGIFFVNEWDGSEWIKKQMVPGDSIVIVDYDNDPETTDDRYHEWRVYEEEDGTQILMDTSEALRKEFDEAIEELWDALSAETAERIAADEELQDNIDAEEAARISGDTMLQEMIEAETERAQEAEEELWNALSAETAERIAADEELQDNIDAETERAIERENEIESALTQEIADRIAADEELWDGLSAETAERIAADEELQDNIDAEEARAKEREDAIENALFEEIDRATAAEQVLDEKIDAETERAIGEEERIEGLTLVEGRFEKDDTNAVDKLVLDRKNGENITIPFDANFGELPE